MKCPHRIEPHQIQGLDFIHIYPVVQWLVKRAVETKEEMGDYIRAFSVSQFNKNHKTPEVRINYLYSLYSKSLIAITEKNSIVFVKSSSYFNSKIFNNLKLFSLIDFFPRHT